MTGFKRLARKLDTETAVKSYRYKATKY